MGGGYPRSRGGWGTGAARMSARGGGGQIFFPGPKCPPGTSNGLDLAFPLEWGSGSSPGKIQHRQVTDLGVTDLGFCNPGFQLVRQVLCGDASRLFLDHLSKHLSSVLGWTELCHEVRNPGLQKRQFIGNENHHLALFGKRLKLLEIRDTGRHELNGTRRGSLPGFFFQLFAVLCFLFRFVCL